MGSKTAHGPLPGKYPGKFGAARAVGVLFSPVHQPCRDAMIPREQGFELPKGGKGAFGAGGDFL
ncbi:MAG: hypothetical protein DRH37_04355 [Deltaproteobacteria bacterium]|nr:MAG: hypothetical protein DRH37_04355 [Deltaproteobacteria bacterium]